MFYCCYCYYFVSENAFEMFEKAGTTIQKKFYLQAFFIIIKNYYFYYFCCCHDACLTINRIYKKKKEAIKEAVVNWLTNSLLSQRTTQ